MGDISNSGQGARRGLRLAAIVGLGLVGLLAWSQMHSRDKANAIRDGRATGEAFLSHCAVGIGQAKGRYVGMAGATAWIGEDPKVYPAPLPVEVGCPAKAAIGKATVWVRVSCEDPMNSACVEAVGAARANGEPLKPL